LCFSLHKSVIHLTVTCIHSSDHGRGMRKQKSKAAKGKEKDLRAQLKALLAQPLMLRGLSARYLTSGASAKFASDMLKGTSHGSLLGLSKTRAVEDMRASA
jgi:ATP-dependent RNA helicase DDX24/MAK5